MCTTACKILKFTCECDFEQKYCCNHILLHVQSSNCNQQQLELARVWTSRKGCKDAYLPYGLTIEESILFIKKNL